MHAVARRPSRTVGSAPRTTDGWFAIDMADDSTGLWFYWPMLGAGLVVVITGIGLYGLGGLFGADWERRQVDKYLN